MPKWLAATAQNLFVQACEVCAALLYNIGLIISIRVKTKSWEQASETTQQYQLKSLLYVEMLTVAVVILHSSCGSGFEAHVWYECTFQ